jgi:hypothetical protein
VGSLDKWPVTATTFMDNLRQHRSSDGRGAERIMRGKPCE